MGFILLGLGVLGLVVLGSKKKSSGQTQYFPSDIPAPGPMPIDAPSSGNVNMFDIASGAGAGSASRADPNFPAEVEITEEEIEAYRNR